LKNPSQKRADGLAQGVGPEFKPWYCKKKKKMLLLGLIPSAIKKVKKTIKDLGTEEVLTNKCKT
jgi:hypothetical protein